MRRPTPRALRIAAVVLGATGLAVCIGIGAQSPAVRSAVDSVLTWGRAHRVEGAIGLPLLALSLDVPPVVLQLPGHFLLWSLPVVFGYALGALQVALVVSTSAMIQFALGRWLLYRCVRRRARASSLFRAVDAAIARRGLSLVLLLRASLIPDPMVSYGLSVTEVSLRDYALGAALETCKRTCATLYIAFAAQAVAGSTSEAAADRASLIALCVSAPFLGAALWMLCRRVRVELRAIEESRAAAEAPNAAEHDVEEGSKEGAATAAAAGACEEGAAGGAGEQTERAGRGELDDGPHAQLLAASLGEASSSDPSHSKDL